MGDWSVLVGVAEGQTNAKQQTDAKNHCSASTGAKPATMIT